MKHTLLALLSIALGFSEIIHEQGSLTEFIVGNSSETSYENWLSHVTEGISSPGFNDYGPEWLDIQTNGFGNHRVLSENSQTLDYWETIFTYFVIGDTTLVDSLLQDSIQSFFYELVVFQDTTYGRTFHLLREQLDSSYIDYNNPEIDDDDVIGGFRNGWGLYIISPDAFREQILIQVPHPCDDFIAPYVALDIFLKTDSFGFMIAGAGREVAWSEIGDYSNSKSISDPSRYPHTVFQKFQDAITEPLVGINPHWPLVFAIHSFDNLTHLNRKSIIMAAGGQNPFTSKPIRDITDDHLDIVNFTNEYPISIDQFGNPEPLHVTDYYEVFYDDACVYDNGSDEFPITIATELKGPSNGVQMLALQSQFSSLSVYEPWVHVELDEKPMLFDELELSDSQVYNNGVYPVGIQNFQMLLEFYDPFVTAVLDYLNNWETVQDMTEPSRIESISAYNVDNSDQVYLNWSPVFDTNFKSYQIQADLDTFYNNPFLFDLADYNRLQYMREDEQFLNGLNNTQEWWLQIRAVDYFSNVGEWSESVTNRLPGHGLPDTLVSFNDNISISSIIGEDQDIDDFFIDTNQTIPGSSPTLSLFGNTWKSISIEPFSLDSGTTLQVFAKVDSLSEIQAIGFSNGIDHIRYALFGSEILNIEHWIPVYQGVNPIGEWASYRLPIGDDWLAWYDSLSILSEIHFINDHDNTQNTPGNINFSMVRDITPDLPIAPKVSFHYEQIETRNEQESQIVSISFSSTVQDTDSYSFSYFWEFGDGATSQLPNPIHDYIIEDDHNYSVLLVVEDETGQRDWSSEMIEIDQGNTSFPITMNFVGDIMMGRRFENTDGIIPNQGVEALFEPTIELLGNASDLTIANLEIPLTNQGTPHPTKGVVFRCAPENVSGLLYGGIDVVSLANNHILDYMEPGMIQTMNILNEAGIVHSGAGLNSYQAYMPAFKSVKGQTIAFLSTSDRTGQYNNYQPFLHAGENKPGFAYMTPYYIKQQIQSVKNFSNIVVVEMHAGSEYSLSPGSDYDYIEFPERFESLKTNPASQIGFTVNPKTGTEVNDYSWRLDRPQMWDRAIRHFAIDEGADLVIVHHPHIIQGVEVYNNKLIAHSLGNFIFDLNYPETYPSMILNVDVNQNGLAQSTILPLYIDDYLTKPANGELGNYILDYIAMKSKELHTYVHVDTDNQIATVVLDSNSMNEQHVDYNTYAFENKITQIEGNTFLKWEPIKINSPGSLSEIVSGSPFISHYRLGREKVWMNNFENEGSSLWNLNSESEILQDSVFRRGRMGLLHKRNSDSPSNIVTNLEERLPFRNDLSHSLHGYIKTLNGKNVTIEARYFDSRSGESLFTVSMEDSVNGDNIWKKYWDEIPKIENAEFIDIRMNSDIPDSGQSFSYFDDVGLIEWDSIKSVTSFPISIINPNNYQYIQFFSTETDEEVLESAIKNTIIGHLDPLTSIPMVVSSSITAPGYFYFFENSKGPVGQREWSYQSDIFSEIGSPMLFVDTPGIYQISLKVTGPFGEENSNIISIIALEEGSEPYHYGDVNGDGTITAVDALLCANYTLDLMDFQPVEFLAADIDGSGSINVFDVLLIVDLIGQ